MAYKNNGGATAGANAGANAGTKPSAVSGLMAGAAAGMNYDSIPFKNSAIDMIRLKEQAKNQGMKMTRTLKEKPQGFMDRVRNR